jgi:signal transduction histidine kinase
VAREPRGRDRAARTVENQARAVALTNLRRHLRVEDFTAPVSPARRAALDRLFRQNIILPGVVGGGLVSPNGTVTYSARHERIGAKAQHPNVLAAVLAGQITRRVTHVLTWRGQKQLKVLQILAPVRETLSGRPIGVIGLDQDYRAVAVGTGDAHLRLALILAFALLALFVTLLPIMNRLTRQLEVRNRRLRELAEERGNLLEGERAARTEAEAVQRLLSAQNERLRELDRLKDEFVSLVSHELRTPLTSIRGYIELLLDDAETGSNERRYLEIVDRNSERLLELVSDLLFLAQIEAGKLGIERRQVDLSRIVEECIETSSPVADSRGIELSATVDRVPKLEGDRARLAQVLDNLVQQAQVHGARRPGRVRLTTGTERPCSRSTTPARHSGRRAGASVRAVLPQFQRNRECDPGHGSRTDDHEGDRRASRRPDRSRERRERGHDGPRAPAARSAAGSGSRVTRRLGGSVPVAEASDGLDRGLAAGRLAELAAEVAHVELHLVAFGAARPAPGQLDQLVVGEHLVGVADERAQEPELERRQRDLLPAGPHRPLGEIDLDEPVSIVLRRLLPVAAAAQVRVDPRQKLLAAERLRHIVVRSRAKAANLVHLLRPRGQHDHRHVAQLPDPVEDSPAVETGHLDVEDDEIRLVGVEPLQAVVAVGGLDHVVPRPLEQFLHQAADVGFVVDDEDAAHVRPPESPLFSLG